MNPDMYANETVQASLRALIGRGATLVEPTEGDVASGEVGQGKLASIEMIVEAVDEVLFTNNLLTGKKVLITSGPTQEPIDSVRYISNHSSGKMGSAVARAALKMGASVTVIAGPQVEALPLGATVRSVKTAIEMFSTATELAPKFDIIVGVAAVADYRVANPISGKLRRSNGSLSLEFTPNPDIIAGCAKAAPNALVVGFAAEPTTDLTIAKEKIGRKGLFAIAANDISEPSIGFGALDNRLSLLFADGSVLDSGLQTKFRCALWLLEQVIFRHNQTDR